MDADRSLFVLWTNPDPISSQFMVMMYVTNSMIHGWWDEITVIIWGATAKLAAENKDVQERIRIAQNAGVRFSACVACARELGVCDELADLGIELKGWGQPLTELLYEKKNLMTV